MSMSKSIKLGTVLNRTASYLVSNGQILRSAPLGQNASLFRYANAKGIKLVNSESIKGLSILDELHSHALKPRNGNGVLLVRDGTPKSGFEFADVV